METSFYLFYKPRQTESIASSVRIRQALPGGIYAKASFKAQAGHFGTGEWLKAWVSTFGGSKHSVVDSQAI